MKKRKNWIERMEQFVGPPNPNLPKAFPKEHFQKFRCGTYLVTSKPPKASEDITECEQPSSHNPDSSKPISPFIWTGEGRPEDMRLRCGTLPRVSKKDDSLENTTKMPNNETD